MSNRNSFRPLLNTMEDRALMSVTLTTPQPDPQPTIQLYNTMVTSVQPTEANGEHILLARQVPVLTATHSSGGAAGGIVSEGQGYGVYVGR